MSSNENPPSLSLSDIMHPMSPSPAPVEDQLPDAHRPRYDPDALQEPLTDSEVLTIRSRLQELGLVMSYGSANEELPIPRLGVASHLNLREKELIDMILRLTSCPRIDTTQFEEQAATISALTTQRDYLVAEAEEERLKLQFEREIWNRTAEALLTQKTRPSSKFEDTDTQRAAYETEIKSLREKLHDRHRRLSALEQEILRLKPLLLMQPYSNQRLKQTLASQSQNVKVQDKGKTREVDTPSKMTSLKTNDPEIPQKFNPTAYPYGYQYKPEVSIPSGQSSSPRTFLLEEPPVTGPSSQRRRSKDHTVIQKGKKQRHYRSTTMSDAYAEHLLLAAQRIGRKRASLVTGLQRLADREKDVLARERDQHRSRKEQERLDTERLGRLASGTPSMAYYRPSEDSSPGSRAVSTPTGSKTPKRGGYSFSQHHNANPGGVNTPPPSTFVFVNTSATRMPKPAAYSPGSPSRPDATSSTIRSTNPPTPLDSLVDAARMMGDSGDRSNARRRLLEEPESPTAKRRKVATDKGLVSRGASKLGRVQSGLDVLADQAAAVEKPGQTSTQLSANDSLTISNRKGKGKANAQQTDPEWKMPPKTRSSTRTLRPSSRRLSASHAGLASASAPTVGRGTNRTQGLSRRTDTPEPRVIALPTILSSGFDTSSVTRLGLNLRPVTGWGDRPVPDDDDDDSDSTCDSPTRNDPRNLNAVEINTPLPTVSPKMERVLAPSVTQGSDTELVNGYDEEIIARTHTPTHHIAGDSRDVAPSTLAQSSIRQTLATDKSTASQPPSPVENPVSRTPSQEPSRQVTLGPAHADQRESEEYSAGGADADEDEDAEGEEDEENDENDAEMGSKFDPSRSRSPPPDPPGNDDLPGNDQDPDADADGDMDVDDKETPPSGASPAHHQQTVMDASIPIKPTFESINPYDRA